jgi:hypothetical protein
MAQKEVSPVTPIDRRQLEPQEHAPRQRTYSEFRPPSQQQQETSISQRIDSAIQSVKSFFGFADSLRQGPPQQRQRQEQ